MSDLLTLAPGTDRPAPSFLAGPPKQLLIGGRWVEPHDGRTVDSIDPYTEEPLTTISVAGSEDVDAAVAAARRAFEAPSWAAMTAYQRSRVLLQIADLVEEHAEELSTLDTLDMGASHGITRWFSRHGAEVFRYYAGWPTKINGVTGPSGPGQLAYTLRQPLGVVAAIVGWNGPMDALSWKIGAALATGNTVVYKPAEWASLSALRFGELLAQTDLPPGVVNIVTGQGRTTGEALITHRGVDKVAFTGSTGVGKHILRASADDLKRVTLELGGKSPTIVFPDADLEVAARSAAGGFLAGSGQGCVMGTRIFVHESVREQFSALLAEQVAGYGVGDPFHPGVAVGPLASRQHYEKVTSYFDVAREDGAHIAIGADQAADGLFVRPTLFDRVTNDMRIAQEEIFGPVAAIMPFTETEEVLALANDTIYGLAASVWTKDVGRAHHAAARLQAGTVWVNTWGVMTPELPFGGYKQSGIGRENGAAAVDDYTETKTVILQYQDAGYSSPGT